MTAACCSYTRAVRGGQTMPSSAIASLAEAAGVTKPTASTRIWDRTSTTWTADSSTSLSLAWTRGYTCGGTPTNDAYHALLWKRGRRPFAHRLQHITWKAAHIGCHQLHKPSISMCVSADLASGSNCTQQCHQVCRQLMSEQPSALCIIPRRTADETGICHLRTALHCCSPISLMHGMNAASTDVAVK